MGKPVPNSKTRFTFQQFMSAVEDIRDENWMFQAFIKIHSVVLQKSRTYRRLFHEWRFPKSKAGAFRLTKEELMAGLKKLKAGLNQDEINQLCAAQVYEGRDNAISYSDFEDKVKSGAATLQSELSYERMLLTDWIM
jgi:hypothetical protein